MNSSVSPKEEIWFLRVCHHISIRLYDLRPAVKKMYQFRHKVSASRVSVASRVVIPKHDELRPAVGKELYHLNREIWVYKSPTTGKFLHSFIVLYTQLIICTHTKLLNDIDHIVGISCYCLMFKPH